MYELNGSERKETTTQKIECGEAVTDTYYVGDTIVRVDKTINVDPVFMAKILVGI